MKNIINKKIFFTLSLLLVSAPIIQAHGGGNGGAWAGGTAIGLGTGLLIGSQMNKGNSNNVDTSSAAVTKELRQVRKEKTKLIKDYNNKKISQADYQQQLKSLNDQISDLQSQL